MSRKIFTESVNLFCKTKKNIGLNLNKICKEKFSSQVEMANILGIYDTELSGYINAKRQISLERVCDFAEKLGVSVSNLVAEVDDDIQSLPPRSPGRMVRTSVAYSQQRAGHGADVAGSGGDLDLAADSTSADELDISRTLDDTQMTIINLLLRAIADNRAAAAGLQKILERVLVDPQFAENHDFRNMLRATVALQRDLAELQPAGQSPRDP